MGHQVGLKLFWGPGSAGPCCNDTVLIFGRSFFFGIAAQPCALPRVSLLSSKIEYHGNGRPGQGLCVHSGKSKTLLKTGHAPGFLLTLRTIRKASFSARSALWRKSTVCGLNGFLPSAEADGALHLNPQPVSTSSRLLRAMPSVGPLCFASFSGEKNMTRHIFPFENELQPDTVARC